MRGVRTSQLVVAVVAAWFCVAGGAALAEEFFVNGVGQTMVWIPPGSFTMGARPGEPGAKADEGPPRVVTLGAGFWMAAHEVTRFQYAAVCSSVATAAHADLAPAKASLPMARASRGDALRYCSWLTERERAAGRLPAGFRYRLPTEAEWEFACRAGSETPWHGGTTLTPEQACFGGADEPEGQENGSRPVGSFPPNAFGLYDMHGNVEEWCVDRYAEAYTTAPVDGTPSLARGPAGDIDWVLRGGSFSAPALECRSSARRSLATLSGENFVGFNTSGVRPVLARRRPDLDRALLAAVATGGPAGARRVQDLVDGGADVDARDARGRTPLNAALESGDATMAEALVAQEPDVSIRAPDGTSPVQAAARLGLTRLVRDLERRGVAFDRRDPATAALRARLAQEDAAEARKRRRAEFNLFPIVARLGHPPDVARLDAVLRERPEALGDVEAGVSPLMKAAAEGRMDWVRLLVERGADAAFVGGDGYTALALAAARGKNEVIGYLLERGASLATRVKGGQTPLHLAAKFGRPETVALLLARGADRAAEDGDGKTALELAADDETRAAFGAR